MRDADTPSETSFDPYIAFGYAIVCRIDGRNYYNAAGRHYPEEEVLSATLDFMERSRRGLLMHTGADAGEVLFSLPLVGGVVDAFGWKARTTGWLVGWRPFDDNTITRLTSRELIGFSVGGSAEEHDGIVSSLQIDEVSLVDLPSHEPALVVHIDRFSNLRRQLPGLDVLFPHIARHRITPLPDVHIRATRSPL